MLGGTFLGDDDNSITNTENNFESGFKCNYIYLCEIEKLI